MIRYSNGTSVSYLYCTNKVAWQELYQVDEVSTPGIIWIQCFKVWCTSSPSHHIHMHVCTESQVDQQIVLERRQHQALSSNILLLPKLTWNQIHTHQKLEWISIKFHMEWPEKVGRMDIHKLTDYSWIAIWNSDTVLHFQNFKNLIHYRSIAY